MKPEIIASLIGTIITAIVAIVVAIIQRPSENRNGNIQPSLIVPQGYKVHHSKNRIWFWVFPITVVGGIVGYLFGTLLYRPQPATDTLPTQTAQTTVSETTNVNPPIGVTPEVTLETVLAVVTETTEINPWMATIPSAGTQLNFSPTLLPGQNADDIPNFYKMSPSPYSGIFLAQYGIGLDDVPTSWEVHYKDGEVLPAQSEKCYINQGYPEMWQSPLNLTANDSSTTMTIFVDSRYSMLVKSVEVFVTKFQKPRESADIDYIKVLVPGAGGMGIPLTSVRTNRVFVDSDLTTVYQIDFQDFILKPQEGVNIFVPITFVSEGNYQIQFKIIGQAIPTYNGDKEGDFTLTTGRFSYGWINISEPLDFQVNQEKINNDGSNNDYESADLIPCP